MASIFRPGEAGMTVDRLRYARYLDSAPGIDAFRHRADVDYARSLSVLIENEIIPRLVVAHQSDTPLTQSVSMAPTIAFPEVEALAALALQVEADALLVHVQEIMARGVTVDTILVNLLAPTARLLGEYWEDDRCDFVDVTMGLWRLQEIVHELAQHGEADRRIEAGGSRALFASMPGDQHSFGTVVIDELFRREGWITDRLSDAETPDLLKRVASEWFDLVGLTISCDCNNENLASVIVALRNVSRNPRVCIMVGGRVFSADPQLALRVGADGTAADAKLALSVARGLVDARAVEATVG